MQISLAHAPNNLGLNFHVAVLWRLFDVCGKHGFL